MFDGLVTITILDGLPTATNLDILLNTTNTYMLPIATNFYRLPTLTILNGLPFMTDIHGLPTTRNLDGLRQMHHNNYFQFQNDLLHSLDGFYAWAEPTFFNVPSLRKLRPGTRSLGTAGPDRLFWMASIFMKLSCCLMWSLM